MTTVAIVADTHVNSTVAVCPPTVQRDKAGEYHASKAQVALWDKWQEFWTIANERKRGKLYAVIVGDVCDLNSHNGVELISHNRADIIRASLQVLEPMVNVADRVFIVRGTEAHTGPGNELEELIGEMIGATPDTDSNTRTWYWLPMLVDGVRFDFAHHPETDGNRPWTEDAAMARCGAIVRTQCLEQEQPVPDIVVRAHKHKLDDYKSKTKKPLVLFTPSWQLTTSFGYRLAAAGSVRPVGGWILDCENGSYSYEVIRYSILGRKTTWTETLDSPKPTLLQRFASLWASKTSQTTREP